jgi:putative serine protease PepD
MNAATSSSRVGHTNTPPSPRTKHTGYRWWLVALLSAVLLAVGSCAASPSTSRQGTPGATSPAPTVAVPPAAADLEQTVQTVIRRVQPSIVEVESSGSQGQAIGSGNVIATGGYIVTNDHVVRGFQRFQVVLADGQTMPATLVGEAPDDDLAVLKVNATAGLRPITLGDSSAVQVGAFVLAIGSPLGLDQSATFGIVSALSRTASEAPNGPAGTLTGLIQTSAPINAGNSGGALVNLRGELIGIPTLAAGDPNGGGAAYGIGFAIPSNRVRFIADQLIKSGRVTNTGQGYLGITGVTVTADIAAAYGLPWTAVC